jgi:plasmid stability protein
MATLQVKGLDDALYKALAARAARDHRSVSQEVVTLIQDFLSCPAGRTEQATEEFLSLAGSWADERPAQTIAREIRRGRRAGRRFGSGDVFA